MLNNNIETAIFDAKRRLHEQNKKASKKSFAGKIHQIISKKPNYNKVPDERLTDVELDNRLQAAEKSEFIESINTNRIRYRRNGCCEKNETERLFVKKVLKIYITEQNYMDCALNDG